LRPNLTPLTIARLRPSPVRSRIKSRSKSVTESTSPCYIWNASESVPIGLYRLQPIERLTATDLVAIRPPGPLAHFLNLNGYLPLGVRMLKRVLALPGLTVCRTGPTIAVDNVEVGQARERDGRGRLLPVWQGCRVVAADELFVMNWHSEESLDGRYFRLRPSWLPRACRLLRS
jgi:type IV secretory pathway protease TraF